jgi:hypothetical protein
MDSVRKQGARLDIAATTDMSSKVCRVTFLAAAVFSFLTSVSGQTSLVNTGAVWKYWDQGSVPGNWTALLFNDSSWSNGPAQLGFGDGDEATVISRVNTAGATNIAFYFRHRFTAPDPSAFTNLLVRLRRDDGAIVYLNEVEIFRSNMPPGPANSNTLAAANASDDGTNVFAGPVSLALLTTGDNQLAVEVHQRSVDSSDVSFDLELVGNVTFQAPTVALVAPVNNETIGASAFAMVASASDNDGTVASVEFYDGWNLLGTVTTPTNSYFVVPWTGVSVGAYSLTAVATDSTGVSSTSAPVAITVVPFLVPRHAFWKYLDDGSDPGAGWQNPAFVDDAWLTGQAQLGYGDGDETTVLREFDALSNKIVTFHFRHSFSVADPRAYSNLVVRVQRDDGAIVYLNGTEVFRNNMAPGPVGTTNTALIALDDDAFHGMSVSTSLLATGVNVLAVEIHQANLTSSDVSFDLELLPNVSPAPPMVTLTAPSNGASFVGPINLTLSATTTDVDSPVNSVVFLDGPNPVATNTVDVVGLASASPLLIPGPHSLRAVAIDATGLSRTSAPVSITVVPAPVFTTLVATGSVWRFYDTNTAPVGNWKLASYDDSLWRSGPGILGYGVLNVSGAPRTIINGGTNLNRHISAYFRHVFDVTDAADFTNLDFRVLRDDGVVAYLNGAEIFRMNMPTGTITSVTRANANVAGTNELYYAPTNIIAAPGLLLEGQNILAAELHQDRPDTSDGAFDLSLVGVAPPLGTVPRLRIQRSGANVTLSWSVPGFVLQAAAQPRPPYNDIPNSSSPYTVTPSFQSRFFRLRQQ